jgi:heptosyltransferase-2
VERADCLLCGLAVDLDRPIPLIAPQTPVRATIRARFAAFPRPWFVLGIGSSEAYKQWGASNFSALANSLLQRYGGSCFLLGGNSEQVMADGISQELGRPGNLVSLIQMPLQDVIALLAEAQLFFGNDTGMLNLSAACGTHSIGLFGHPISAWVANSSPRIHPVYPEAGLSNDGVSQIKPSRVLQAVNQLELLHEFDIGV